MLKPWPSDPWPHETDLGVRGGNPLLELATRRDPVRNAWRYSSTAGRTLHVGALDDVWLLARPERSLMVLGPPRDTGKTTSVLVPTVLSAYAPVVATSTKEDVFAATAQTRALMGTCWCFAPDGGPTPPGTVQLRWSPITTAIDWDKAVDTVEIMVAVANETLGSGSSHEGTFWSIQAAWLLALLLHAAAIRQLNMRVVMDWIEERDMTVTAQILKERQNNSPGTYHAYKTIVGAGRTAEGEISGYWGSAAAALSTYRPESARATTDDPNFDPVAFVDARFTRPGKPPQFDTIYINSSGQKQRRLAPLIVALLNEIKEARYQLDRKLRS